MLYVCVYVCMMCVFVFMCVFVCMCDVCNGHAGAFAAMQRQFPGACIYRDLQHVKKNIKDNAGKLQDTNLKTYITDVGVFSEAFATQ